MNVVFLDYDGVVNTPMWDSGGTQADSPKYCAVCGAYIPDALDKCLACGKKIHKTRNNDSILQYYGFSTDVKPTVGMPNASTFYTLDTGETFMFEEPGVWYRLSAAYRA